MEIEFEEPELKSFGFAQTPFSEHLACAGNKIVTNDYVTGCLWSGLPKGLQKLPIDGQYTCVGGDGEYWAALDSVNSQIVVGYRDDYSIRKCKWASHGVGITTGRNCIWLSLPESILQISLTCDEVLDNLKIRGGTVIATDVERDYLAVACTEFHRVIRVDKKSNNFKQIDSFKGRRFRFPRGLTYASDGSLWIADTENRMVVSEDRSFDFTRHPGFPVGLGNYNNKIYVAFPYERIIASLEEAEAIEPETNPPFYPYSIARFNGELWLSYPASGIVQSCQNGTTYDELADPIAIISWREQLAVAERDRSCVTCFQANGANWKIMLPEGSQPRALSVSPDGVLWVITQTPKMLFACRSNYVAEMICLPEFDGVPRAIAWTNKGIALASNREKAVLWIDDNDGRIINKTPLPESPVSLSSDGESVLAGFDRIGAVFRINHSEAEQVANNVITPRGLLLEGNHLYIVESLAHRVTCANLL